VSTQVWILAAVSIPLTFLTVALWWVGVYMSTFTAESADEEVRLPKKQNKAPLLVSWRENKSPTTVDPEAGRSPGSVGTWSTNAPTVKG